MKGIGTSLGRVFPIGLGARDDVHPILLVAAYVLDFTCIHPFLDGNGRMSRLLTLLALYRQRYPVGRYVSLERVIAESKETYLDSLEASNHGWHESRHDPQPWFEYFVGMLIATYSTFEERVDLVTSRRGAKRTAIIGFVEHRAIPNFTMADIRDAVPTASDAMIRKTLSELRSDGRVRSLGRGRAARWERIDAPPRGSRTHPA